MFTRILSGLRTTSRNYLAEHVYTDTIMLVHDLKKLIRKTCLPRYYQAYAQLQEMNSQNMFTPILSGLRMKLTQTWVHQYYQAYA